MKKETKEFITGGVVILAIILFFVSGDNENTESPTVQKEENIIKKDTTAKKEVIKEPTLKGGYGACTNEAAFDEFTTAVYNKDEKLLDYLLREDCFITKAGIKISILDRSFTGTTKVRAYVGEDSFILYTYNENILN